MGGNLDPRDLQETIDWFYGRSNRLFDDIGWALILAAMLLLGMVGSVGG